MTASPTIADTEISPNDDEKLSAAMRAIEAALKLREAELKQTANAPSARAPLALRVSEYRAPVPRNTLGEYSADYTLPTPEELSEEDPEVAALYANSRPASL